jgi:hypothetical protein
VAHRNADDTCAFDPSKFYSVAFDPSKFYSVGFPDAKAVRGPFANAYCSAQLVAICWSLRATLVCSIDRHA